MILGGDPDPSPSVIEEFRAGMTIQPRAGGLGGENLLDERGPVLGGYALEIPGRRPLHRWDDAIRNNLFEKWSSLSSHPPRKGEGWEASSCDDEGG